MSDEPYPTGPEPVTPDGPVEEKTKAGALATLAGAFILFTVLSSVTTDMIASWPDWVETPLYSLILAGASFAGAYLKSHKPGRLSLSALRAAARS
jgi:hypothetical protein